MDKRILLIGGNFFPEPTGIGKYNGEMIDWFSRNGYSCTVITTYPYYPYWNVQDPYKKKCFWYTKESRKVSNEAQTTTIIRAPHYVPRNPSGLKRILSDFSFFFTSYLLVLTLLFDRKFDYVITVAPPFQIGLLAILYKKIKGAKFLYHIQDLQIDAAKDLKMIKSAFILKILFTVERFILNNADTISTISAGMKIKVAKKCNKDVLICPNWVDSDKFFPIMDKSNLKKDFGYSPSDTIILYSGAIGEKQGLDAILHSAKEFLNLPHVKFVICGSGPYKVKLEQLKAELQLENVIFSPLQPLHRFNEFLNTADIHLVLQKANASDLVMPSKLTTILSVGGVAVVTANPGTSLHDIIYSGKMGILIEPENQEALTCALKDAILNFDIQLAKNARAYAEKNLEINQVLSKYSKDVLNYNLYSGSFVENKMLKQKIVG